MCNSGRLSVVKDTLNFATRVVLGTQSTNPLVTRIPRFLYVLLRFSKSKKCIYIKDAVLSILTVIRMIQLKPVIDVRSIVSPFTGRWPDAKLHSLVKAAQNILSPGTLTKS